MNKTFFDIGISLDGYIAGEDRGPQNPLGNDGTRIHNWMYRQKEFWKTFGIDKGEDGPEGQLISQTFARTGAYIMGKRVFEEGEANWPMDLFKTPVFVLTHEKRAPWVQRGGTTFYFTSEPIKELLRQAKEAAGKRDVRIHGGAETIRQFLHGGLVDEFFVHTAPVVLGSGLRLFDLMEKDRFKLEVEQVSHSPLSVHTKYKVINYQ
ncbi:MAG: dihydrofolate reductase family protein [Pseudobacter sp.]|uniref:dihydrofolate reductase family protein n=1 Tax=Pseudobacter sp. TaxID=2045420 RepID=UPI003F7CE845